MDRAFVTWDPDVVRMDEVGKSPHPVLSKTGYYCLLAAKLDEAADHWADLDLLFVGGAHDSTMRAALLMPRDEHGKARDLAAAAGKELVVMIGQVTETTLARVTRPFLDDVEACLALRNGAKVVQFPPDYQQRRHLSVVNRGDFAPLAWRSLFRAEA